MFIIFLDIDGVLFSGFNSVALSNQYNKIFNECSKEKPIYSTYVYAGILNDYVGFKAQAHFFNKTALSNLSKIIKHLEKKGMKVGIVLSSTWREFFDTEMLRKLFDGLEFANYLIDKTYDGAGICLADKAELDPYPRELSRSELIELWLKQHPETANQFLILDDVDSGLSELFPEHFVHCKNLYGEAEYQLSTHLLDKLFSQNKEIPAQPIENSVLPAVVKTFKDSRTYNERLPTVSMRVLAKTRLSFLGSKLQENTPFKKESKITNLILEYEKDDKQPRLAKKSG